VLVVKRAAVVSGSSRAHARVAVLAALAATLGDLAMLYVVNAARPELALASPPSGFQSVGAWLGILGIPLYGFGYRAASALLDARRERARRIVFVAGSLGGVLGGLIHGLTAREIARAVTAGSPPLDPWQAVTAVPALVALWAVATLALVMASLALAAGVRGGRHRSLAWLNPVTLTIAFGVFATPTLLLQSFLAPAAPNLAHLVFFALCVRGLGRDEASPS
jgi:hypothetical protein